MILLLVQILVVFLNTLSQASDLPPRQSVLQVFLLVSSGPFRLHFQDTFCPGLATFIWDNDVFLGTTPSIQNYCGISARGDTSVIISPIFTQGDYFFGAGFHNLTVLIYGSPTPNGKATLQLTIFPEGGSKILLNKTIKRELKQQEVQAIIPQNPQPANWIIDGESKRKRKTLKNNGKDGSIIINNETGMKFGKIELI